MIQSNLAYVKLGDKGAVLKQSKIKLELDHFRYLVIRFVAGDRGPMQHSKMAIVASLSTMLN